MAVAVPLLIGSTATGAAIAGAIGISAGALATAVGVVFQVTGVNDKINKAASKVFGEDLVNVANIFGTVYSAATGSWDLSDEAGSLFGGGAEVVDAAPSIDASAFAGPPTEAAFNLSAQSGLEGLTPTSMSASSGAFNVENSFDTGPAVTETSGYSMTGGRQPSNSVGTDVKQSAFKDSAQTSNVEQVSAPEPQTTGAASAPAATAPKATGAQTLSNAATQGQKVPAIEPGDGSFLGKLMKRLDVKATDATMMDKMIAGGLASIPQAYSASKAQDMAERKYQDELARSKYRPTVRTRF